MGFPPKPSRQGLDRFLIIPNSVQLKIRTLAETEQNRHTTNDHFGRDTGKKTLKLKLGKQIPKNSPFLAKFSRF